MSATEWVVTYAVLLAPFAWLLAPIRLRREPAPGEGPEEQRANLDDAARRAGDARKARGQTHRRTAAEKRAREEPQPPDTPRL